MLLSGFNGLLKYFTLGEKCLLYYHLSANRNSCFALSKVDVYKSDEFARWYRILNTATHINRTKIPIQRTQSLGNVF